MEFLEKLERLLQSRKDTQPEGSYTSVLFSSGVDRILKKIGEEAGEVIIAAKNKDRDELLNESADLLFHLMVLLVNEGHSLEDVAKVLEARH